jgi:hypothetical protein
VWHPEMQPSDINEEEAIVIAMANSELDQLAMWDGPAMQLCESSLAHGRPATAQATSIRIQACAPFYCSFDGHSLLLRRRFGPCLHRMLPFLVHRQRTSSQVDARVHRPR